MAHIFEGEPDARQSPDPIKPSRFRTRYRPLTGAEIQLHDEIKGKAAELEALIERTAPSRYQSLALTDLELSVMWAIKGLTS